MRTTRRAFCLLLPLLLWPAAFARADARAGEYEVKAAFIVNFVQFIEWPAGSFESAAAPMVIATVGADPFHGALEESCADVVVGGRPLVVKHFATAAKVHGAHVLIVTGSSDNELVSVLQRIGSSGLLTIGETDQFISNGGVIRFYQENKHLRFEINQEAVERARLQISAKLRRLAKPSKR